MMRARAAPVVLLALIAVGCAAFVPKLKTPHLAIESVELEHGDLLTQYLKVRMRVANPNDMALPIKGLSYRIEVDGEELARGVSSAAFTVPPLGEADFDMDVTANLAGALIRLLAHRDSGIDYHITGKVDLARGFLRSVPFDEHGRFALR